MSEILTFNLPISISRERWDAIIREAARKVYTEGLVDPGDALMPEVAKAATAALQPSPGIVCGDSQQALPLPAPVEPAKEGGPDRPIPPGAWERLNIYIRGRSVPTAALLAQKASILRWTSGGHVEIKMTKPFAEQFNRQPAKIALLVAAVREVFGPDSYPRLIVLSDAKDAMGKVPVDQGLIDLVDLIKTGEWDHIETGVLKRMREFAQLWVKKEDGSGHRTNAFYAVRSLPGVLLLRHNSKAVRRLLGRHPNNTLRRWLEDGILLKCRGHSTDSAPRFSVPISIAGKCVQVCKINVARLEALGLSVNLFKFPEKTP